MESSEDVDVNAGVNTDRPTSQIYYTYGTDNSFTPSGFGDLVTKPYRPTPTFTSYTPPSVQTGSLSPSLRSPRVQPHESGPVFLPPSRQASTSSVTQNASKEPQPTSKGKPLFKAPWQERDALFPPSNPPLVEENKDMDWTSNSSQLSEQRSKRGREEIDYNTVFPVPDELGHIKRWKETPKNPSGDFMQQIRNTAVFAWALTGVTGALSPLQEDPLLEYRAADGSTRNAILSSRTSSERQPEINNAKDFFSYRAADGSIRRLPAPPSYPQDSSPGTDRRHGGIENRLTSSEAKELEDFFRSNYWNNFDTRLSDPDASPSIDNDTWNRSPNRFGWQIGLEKFLYHGTPSTVIESTDREILGDGRGVKVKEVRVKGQTLTLARKSITIRRSEKRLKLDLIRNEIQNMRALQHPHIINVIGCYPQGENTNKYKFNILMEPVGDYDLAHFLQTGTPDLSIISKWPLCLLSGLAYIHSQDIRHEDIKPQNIIVHGQDVMYTDFGSSTRMVDKNSTTTHNIASATRLYAAPEALYDRVTDTILPHGTQTDVYSLGMVFVEMVTFAHYGNLEKLHEYLEQFPEFRRSGEKEYHRVADVFGKWFAGFDSATVYSELIEPMLRPQRKERVTAHAHCHTISMNKFLEAGQCHSECEVWRKSPHIATNQFLSVGNNIVESGLQGSKSFMATHPSLLRWIPRNQY